MIDAILFYRDEVVRKIKLTEIHTTIYEPIVEPVRIALSKGNDPPDTVKLKKAEYNLTSIINGIHFYRFNKIRKG